MKRIGKDKSSRVVAHKVKGMIDRRRNDGGHSQLRPPTVVCTSVEKEREKKREREREREYASLPAGVYGTGFLLWSVSVLGHQRDLAANR